MPDLLEEIEPMVLKLLEIAWNDAEETTGVVLGAFNLNNPAIRDIRKQLAKRVKGIDETIEGIIQDVIVEATQQGLTRQETSKQLIERGVTDAPMRAELIADTETANAHSAGSLLVYKESGVVEGVEWLTADAACDICGPLNGVVVKIGEEFAPGIIHPSAHPRCRCVLLPVILERAG